MPYRAVALKTKIFDRRDSIVTWLDRRPILIARVDGEFYGMDAVCAHMGCAVLTDVDGHVVECPAHGAKYDIRTGDILAPATVHPEKPCSEERLTVPLRTYAVRVVDEAIEVDVP